MKKAESLIRGLGLSVCTLLVAGSLMLAGCNMDSLGGPDLSAAQELQDASKNNGGGSIVRGDTHNEEGSNKNNGGGSIVRGDTHNEEGSN